jgi:hypothetical protein
MLPRRDSPLRVETGSAFRRRRLSHRFGPGTRPAVAGQRVEARLAEIERWEAQREAPVERSPGVVAERAQARVEELRTQRRLLASSGSPTSRAGDALAHLGAICQGAPELAHVRHHGLSLGNGGALIIVAGSHLELGWTERVQVLSLNSSTVREWIRGNREDPGWDAPVHGVPYSGRTEAT